MKLLDDSMGIHSDFGMSASSSEMAFGSSIDVMKFYFFESKTMMIVMNDATFDV
jgi:hypothetical protein